jgi:hypothetical protein
MKMQRDSVYSATSYTFIFLQRYTITIPAYLFHCPPKLNVVYRLLSLQLYCTNGPVYDAFALMNELFRVIGEPTLNFAYGENKISINV